VERRERGRKGVRKRRRLGGRSKRPKVNAASHHINHNAQLTCLFVR
jgi:hypothetical protein